MTICENFACARCYAIKSNCCFAITGIGGASESASTHMAVKKRNRMSSAYSMKGVQDLLEVFDDKVTITPKGILGFVNKGLKGTKTIPFSSITAIQFKQAGAVFSGYLQFTIPGGNESRGGVFSAASDENSFMFANKSNNELAAKIKEYIEQKVRETRASAAVAPSITSLADELQKLAGLRDSGIISEQEFKTAKLRLIS